MIGETELIEFEYHLERHGYTCKIEKSKARWSGELRRPRYTISVKRHRLSDVISSLCEALETKHGENP